MVAVEKISIALTPDMAAMLRQVVADGEYVSTSEIIRDALRDWKNKRTHHNKALQELRNLWQDGIDSGSAGELNIEEIKIKARDKAKIQ